MIIKKSKHMSTNKMVQTQQQLLIEVDTVLASFTTS